jgi:alpha-tubulin suppressor-like RCC1 family protein
MTHIDCFPFLPASRLPLGRVRRLIRRVAPVLAPCLVAAVLGCREDAESPTTAEPVPALDRTLAHALAFRQVSTGSAHTCGVTTDMVSYCWGDNSTGQLGQGTSTGPETCFLGGGPCSTRPVRVVGGLVFQSVSAGGGPIFGHTCAVTPKSVAYCWGFNGTGQLGDGTTTDRPRPVAVYGGLRFRQVSAGSEHTCGVTTTHVAYCWGRNVFGQLGDGTTTDRLRPVAVHGGLRFRQVSAGGEHTCGLTTDKVAYCWGENFIGQLGHGTSTGPETCFFFNDFPCSTQPVRVIGQLAFGRVNAGNTHTCGLTPGNVAYCWGENSGAQLGHGTSTGPGTCGEFETPCSTRPVLVVGGLGFRDVNGGFSSTCGVTPSHVAYCWGLNDFGQLGIGTSTGPEDCPGFGASCSTRPVQVVGGLAFRAVQAGEAYSCGVTPEHVAYCWGLNEFGQLGAGTSTGPEGCFDVPCSTRPVAVVPPKR